jgi:hypothetical protein
MKRGEFKVVNALLALSHQNLPFAAVAGRAASIIQTLSRRSSVLLALRREGVTSYVSLATASGEGSVPLPGAIEPQDPIYRHLDSASVVGESIDPSPLAPPWDGFASLRFVPFSLQGRPGAVIIGLPTRGGSFRLAPTFAFMLGETLGLVLDDALERESTATALQEIHVLHQLGRLAHRSLDLTLLLPLLAEFIGVTTHAAGCRILIHPSARHPHYHPETTWVPPGADPALGTPPPSELLERCLAERRAVVHPTPEGECWIHPLSTHDESLATVILLHRHPRSPEERTPLRQASDFIESLMDETALIIADSLSYTLYTRINREHEDRLREISVLYQVSRVLAGTMKLDDVIRAFLTAVTYDKGLGFNRAALFLVNEKTRSLLGIMGVGPDSAQAAAEIWHDLHRKNWSLEDAMRSAIEHPVPGALDGVVKTTRIPLVPGAGILAATVLEKRPFNVVDAHQHQGANPELVERFGTRSFATVPILSEDRVQGVLAVDNLFNGRPIGDKDLHLLQTFASQVGLAIRNAQLYNRLERAKQEGQNMLLRLNDKQKLETLGQMALTVAHEVRNPLVSVGGFARRMERRMDPGDPNRRYTGIILRELTRLEKYLGEILSYSKELPLELKRMDLNGLCTHMADFFADAAAAKGVRVELDLAGDLPEIDADRDKLNQVFINLFSNALDALDRGGSIFLRTSPVTDADQVRITFTDTGGGIPREHEEKIFELFFTTKSRGTGLGLPLVKKIITDHHGMVDVRNVPGESVTFLITLPILQKVPAWKGGHS